MATVMATETATAMVPEVVTGVAPGLTAGRVEFRELKRIDELEEMVDLLCTVWSADSPVDLTNASTLWALAEADNYVAGLFVDDRMVAAGVAIRGRAHLHSHIVGVHPDHQGTGLGFLLKQHEAKWAAAEGLPVIRWTYDPLVRRNAYFNLAKLHARVQRFEENLYGSLNDGLNDGDETDRLLIDWEFGAGRSPAEQVATPFDPGGWDFVRFPEAVHFLPGGTYCLVPTPADIEELRKDDPARARAWRFGVRSGFRRAFQEGYEVTSFSPDGWYVLRRR